MDVIRFLDIDANSVISCSDKISQIDRVVAVFFRILGDEYSEPATFESLKVEFKLENPNKAVIKGPFGAGRILYAPRIDSQGIHARMSIQREDLDKRDQPFWSERATFKINSNSQLVGEDGTVLIDMRKQDRFGPFLIAAGIAAALGA